MFCTKCGKKLYDGDAFCAHCGAKVREELLFKTEPTTTPKASKFEDVVFNPPFKAEAERRTQAIEESVSPYSSEPKREKVSFDWNLDGFPAAERKKNDEFEFNWDAVIEKKKETKAVSVEKILPEFGLKIEEEVKPQVEEKETEEETLSIEDLERALFGEEEYVPVDTELPGMTVEYKSIGKKREQDFFTYNAQRDAFQELLDKEKARVEALENERQAQWEEITPADGEVEYVPKKALDFEEVFKEPKLVPKAKEVAVVLPPLTARVMADEEEPDYEVALPPLTARVEDLEPEYQVVLPPLTARVEVEASELCVEEEKMEECPFPGEEPEEHKEELAEEATCEKTKLRYSDVFPAGAFDIVSDDKRDKRAQEEVEDDDDDDDEKGGNKFIKFLIALLTIVVVLEIGVIGVKFLAPDSKIALTVDSLMDKVIGMFSDEEDQPEVDLKETHFETYVSTLGNGAANVGSVSYDENLKFDLNKTYSFDQIAQTNEFKDVAWNGQEDKTNGYYIVEAVVSYYNTWKANHQDDETVVGVNKVVIGEVRSSNNGYYVLNKVAYAAIEGDVLEKTEIVYLEPSQDKIIVKEVKEEAI